MLKRAVGLVNSGRLLEIQPYFWCPNCNTFPNDITDGRCANPIADEDGNLMPCFSELKRVTVIVVED